MPTTTNIRVLLACAALIGCGDVGSTDDAQSSAELSAADFPEDKALPYRGGWLNAAAVLGGLNQHDRLASTTRDDVRCAAMVALAAAIVGGPEAFDRLLTKVEEKRRSDPRDRSALRRTRASFDAKRLTPRHLHETGDALFRAYVNSSAGATDGQIATMIRASGYESVRLSSSAPDDLVESLDRGELFPLSLDMNGDGSGWHVVLVWRDDDDVVRLYDSNDTNGSHVSRAPTAAYREYVEAESEGWPLRSKFRLPN